MEKRQTPSDLNNVNRTIKTWEMNRRHMSLEQNNSFMLNLAFEQRQLLGIFTQFLSETPKSKSV